jgi:hypothetical protein
MIRSRGICAFALAVCSLGACNGNETGDEEPDSDAAANADSGDDVDDSSDAHFGLDAGAGPGADAAPVKDGSLADARAMDGAPGANPENDAARAPEAALTPDAPVTPEASPDEDADELDPDGGVVIPEVRPGPSGRECHDSQASGQLLTFNMAGTAWPAATGGVIAPGTYELEAEERLVGPGASESDTAVCSQYEGPYRENLVVRAGQYLRVYEAISGAFAREVFDYTVVGNTLTRTQTCPSEIPYPPGPLSFTATPSTLLLLDTNFSSCQYLFKYRRKL